MTTLTLVLLSQLLVPYAWYPLAYRVTGAWDLPSASDAAYEHHRSYGYILGVALAYIVPPAQTETYWAVLLVLVPAGAGMLAALLARVRLEGVTTRPLTTAQLRAMAPVDTAPGRTRAVSRGARGRGRMKSSTTRRETSR